MNIDDFLKLPEEQREYLVEMHNKRKDIQRRREDIHNEQTKLSTRLTNLQLECDHPEPSKNYVANENEFGNLTGGGTTYYHCRDCGWRWSE